MNASALKIGSFVPQAQQDAALISAIELNVAIGGVMLLLFILCRKAFTRSYLLHKFSGNVHSSNGIISWLLPMITYRWHEMYETHGLDSMLFLRFVVCCGQMVLIMCAFGLIILLPVDATGRRQYLPTIDPLYASGTAVLSMSNIDASDPRDTMRFWVHLISVYFNSIVCYFFLFRMFSIYHKYVLKHRSKVSPENVTVRIAGVPNYMTDQAVAELLDRFFPGKILAVHHQPHLPNLVALREKIADLKFDKSRALEEYHTTGDLPLIRPPLPHFSYGSWLLFWRKKVDAITYYSQQISALNTQISRLQKEMNMKRTSVVFVTFTDISSAKLCAQSVLDGNPFRWSRALAPEPNDIIWENHSKDRVLRVLQSIFITGLCVFLIIFWMVPVGFASSLANIEVLNQIPGVRETLHLLCSNECGPWIRGVLPSLILTLSYMVLLPLLRFLSKHQGFYSYSLVEDHTLWKFYSFLIFNMFFGSMLATTFFGVIDELLKYSQNPFLIISLLAQQLPSQVLFFINYLLINTFISFGLTLWRPFSIVYHVSRLICCCVKFRVDIEKVYQPEDFDYPYYYGNHILVFLLVLTYSSISPLILPFGLLYFIIGYFVHKHNNLFVHQQPFEGFGNMWPTVFTQSML
eukprot:TRINITY_DN3086_c0_g1_i2.p1 TRINITY_DN3086_c0_g1~~TRINITY_DN3086_c0_g1_i2.p1  ORF type:complete len:634 (-),score=78.98 TRINITY_DN3086_c0_g1_i2:322-2223(-)